MRAGHALVVPRLQFLALHRAAFREECHGVESYDAPRGDRTHSRRKPSALGVEMVYSGDGAERRVKRAIVSEIPAILRWLTRRYLCRQGYAGEVCVRAYLFHHKSSDRLRFCSGRRKRA